MTHTLQVGAVVDRYRVVSVLGDGGTSSVYLVEHDHLGTLHALKVPIATTRDLRRRVLREAQLQATVRHPNVVVVSDVFDVEGSPALLLEHVHGPTLDAWLRNYRPTLNEALAVFRGVLAGVAHAHDQGLIHRDLKPANILLQVTPDGVVAKVADFGLAKSMDPSDARKTPTGMIMGTPAYMAPEQIRDASRADRRSDVYSLGCLLYVLVCGRLPYDAPDILAFYALVNAGAYTPPEELVPDLPECVVATLRATLHGAPGLRVADCGALAALLFPNEGSQSRLSGGVTLSARTAGGQVVTALAAAPLALQTRPNASRTWVEPTMVGEVAQASVSAPMAAAPASQPTGLASTYALWLGVVAIVLLGATCLVARPPVPAPVDRPCVGSGDR